MLNKKIKKTSKKLQLNTQKQSPYNNLWSDAFLKATVAQEQDKDSLVYASHLLGIHHHLMMWHHIIHAFDAQLVLVLHTHCALFPRHH